MIGGSPPWRRTNLFFLPRHASRSRQYCVAVPFSSVSVTFPTLPCASLRPQHRRSTPFKLHNAPVCRNRGRPPSSRSIESAPSALLRLHFSWIRASDTSLGLMGMVQEAQPTLSTPIGSAPSAPAATLAEGPTKRAPASPSATP